MTNFQQLIVGVYVFSFPGSMTLQNKMRTGYTFHVRSFALLQCFRFVSEYETYPIRICERCHNINTRLHLAPELNVVVLKVVGENYKKMVFVKDFKKDFYEVIQHQVGSCQILSIDVIASVRSGNSCTFWRSPTS